MCCVANIYIERSHTVTGYIPSSDAGALLWLQAFSGGISADPATYMLSSADAANIQEVVEAYALALSVATSELTRSKPTIIQKNQAKSVAIELCRSYAQQIKMNAGVDDADKVAIGVRPINTTRTPIPAPGTLPVLNIVGGTPGSQTLRYADSMDPTRRAKPFGVENIQLYVAIGDEPVASPDQAEYHGAFTKNPIGVAFSPADNQKVATYFARWADRQGRVGPWSLPASMAIAA